MRNIAILLSFTFSSALASNLFQTASSFPLTFEANGGQVPNRYNYVLRHDGMQAEFSREGVDFFLSGKSGASGALRLQLLKARRDAVPAAEVLLNGKSNYLLGSDSTRWIRSVPNYAHVRYDEIYPGVSLVFYGAGGDLEHDFTVAPGADPSSIAFRLMGAKKMALSPKGDLELQLDAGTFLLRKPVVYQPSAHGRDAVEAGFSVGKDGIVRFRIGTYDLTRALIIDPIFTFSTYLAGTYADQVAAVTTDTSGNIYLTGYTSSPDFPIRNGEQPKLGCSSGCTNAFITKLDSMGKLIFSTYLGGSQQDYGSAIALDGSGNVIVAGVTESSDFPHAGAISSPSCASNNDCYFLSSLKPDGSALTYSGQVGASEGPYTNGNNGVLAVDASGSAYLAGITDSPNFTITGGALGVGFTGYPNTGTFVLKVDPTGATVYSAMILENAAANPSSTFNSFFLPTGIAVDSSGEATVAGTGGPGLPTTAGVVAGNFPNNDINAENPSAGYVVQLNSSASAINYATYVPGTDTLGGMTVDGSGDVYLTGSTSETTLPVKATAYQKSITAGQNCTCNDGFVVKLNPNGTSVLAASYLGGTPPQSNIGTTFTAIALDSHSNVFVGGATGSTDIPLRDAFTTEWEYTESTAEMVLAEMNSDLSSVSFGSFLSTTDGIYPGSIFSGLALDASDNLVVVGKTLAVDFPTTAGSLQPQPPPAASPYSSSIHSFVSKVNMATPAPSFCPSAWNISFGQVPAQTSSSQTLNVTNCGNAPLNFNTLTTSVPSITATQSCGSVAPGAVCGVTLTFAPVDASTVSGTVSFADNAAISPQVIQLSGQGQAPDLEPGSNPLSFGHLLAGTQGPSLGLVVYNRGNAPLTITNISIAGSGFAIAGNGCIGTTPAGGSCVIGLTFTPPTIGDLSGSLIISSNDPVHGQLIERLTGTGDAVSAAPVISSIGYTPGNLRQTVQINHGPVTLEIIGSNFYPASVVQVNGVTQQTTFINNGLLEVTDASSSLTSLGELPLTVVNPSPGGGTSTAATLTPYNVMTLTPSFLASVPSTGMLYASIPSSTIVNPNTVVPINAATGTLGTPIPVGRNPVLLAASSDGKYLYVALAFDLTVQRINLQTQVVERTFPFPANICTTCGPATPVDLEVVPGNSQEVVLSQGNMLTLYNDAGIVNSVPGTYSNYYMAPFNSVAFAGSPQSIYSLPFTIVQNSFFGTVALDAAGLHYPSVTGTNYGGNDTTGAQVVSDGTLLYTSAGQVWNPATATQVGTFPVTTFNSTSYPNTRNLTIDTTVGELFVVGDQDYGEGSAAVTLTAYGQKSLAITGTLAFPDISSAILGNLVRWGSDGFAFSDPDSGNLYIVSSSIASPQYSNALPTLTSTSPESVNAGGPAFTLTLNGTNFLPSSTVTWNGTLLPVTYMSSTQLTVPVPASDIASSGTAQLAVSNPAPGGGTTQAFSLSITNLTTPTLTLSIPGHTFGDAPFQIGAKSNSPGTISYTVLSGPATISGATLTVTGAGTASVQASQLASGSFGAVSQTASFNIAPAKLTVTISASTNPVLLQNPVTLTASLATTATGTVTFADETGPLGTAALNNGVGTYTSSSLTVGSHVITVSYSGDINFQPATATYTEVVQDFTLALASSSSTSQTAQPGGTATFNLAFSSSGASLSAPVTFTVSGLPPGATGVFSPAFLAAGAAATPVTLTVQLPANLVSFERHDRFRGIVAPLAFAAIVIPFVRRRRVSLGRLVLVFGAGLLTTVMLGCDGSSAGSGSTTSPPPSANTYTLTVTGTSGADVHTTTLTLIVH